MSSNNDLKKQGRLIAAFGIPGSGKSTTTKNIGKILGIKTYHEPEADKWAKAVEMRDKIGNFTAIMWFRSMRVPDLHQADFERRKGETVMVDSYYDKLFFDYHDKEGIEWLFDQSDEYFDEMVRISKKDRQLLADADILIFFKLDEQMWKKFIDHRSRDMDQQAEFRKSFRLQEVFLEVARAYAASTGCKLIIHEQTFGSAEKEAEKITKLINESL